MAGTPQRLNSAQDLTLQNASIVGANWSFDPRAFYKVNDIVVEDAILYQCTVDVPEQDNFFGVDNPFPNTAAGAANWKVISRENEVFLGTPVPAADLGVAGDFYIQNDADDTQGRGLWGHTGSGWIRLDSIGDGALILGDGDPVSTAATRANGVEPREGDRYYNTGTTTTNHEKHWIFESSSWRQWVNSFTITDPGGTATEYRPFEDNRSLQFRDFTFNITSQDGDAANNTFNPLGDADQQLYADRLKLNDGTNDSEVYAPLNSSGQQERIINIRPVQIGDKNYLPLGDADQHIEVHSLNIGGIGYNPVSDTAATTINENTLKIEDSQDTAVSTTFDPLALANAEGAETTIKFANSVITSDSGVHTVTIGSEPLTEAAWFNSNELDRSEDDVNFPSVAAVQEALDVQDFTLSSGVGTSDDPELHTIFVPQLDSDGKVIRDADTGDIATTRWRIVGSTPADVSAPNTANNTYVQYQPVSPKILVYTVSEEGEIFTAQSIVVAQSGADVAPTHIVELLDSDAAVQPDFSGNNIIAVRVTVTDYDEQIVANVRATGTFTVAEGPATREFPNITAQVVASAAAPTSVSFSYGGAQNIQQYANTSGASTVTLQATSNNGAFVSTPATPRVYQVQGGSPVDFNVTLTSDGATVKQWSFNRDEVSSADDNNDVLVDWMPAEVLPTGKTPGTGGTNHTFTAGQRVINIVLISPNTLSASYQLNSANLPGRLNYFAIDDTDTLTATYNHNFNDPNGAYTLVSFLQPNEPFVAGDNSLSPQLTSFLGFGSDSLRVSYVDSRNPTDYNISSSIRGVAIVAPWYIWFTTDSTTPGAIAQSNAVTGSSGFENGQLVSDINSHVITNTAGADNLTVWAAIPLATVGSFTLGGSITTGTLVSPLGTVKWTTETLSPQTAVLSGAPGDIEYQVFQVTVIAAGNTSTINLTLS